MAIRSTVTAQLDIWAVFGFGSFYRGQPFNDIDLLVVASPCCSTYLEAYYEVRKSFAAALQWLEAPIDITFLTYSEFGEAPLLEMDHLKPIYVRRADLPSVPLARLKP
jgi:predicted nucleotidyltransferase